MHESTGEKVGGAIFGLSIVFCSMEMVPRWGIFHLGWPSEVFYTIMIVAGMVSGFLFSPDHRMAGLVGGLFAGPGALFAIALVLANTTWTHSVILVVVGLLGALPGCLVYLLLKSVSGRPSDE